MSFWKQKSVPSEEKQIESYKLNEMQQKLFDDISKKDWMGWKKEAFLSFFLYQLENPSASSSQLSKKGLHSWTKNARYQKILEQQLQDAQTRFTLSNIVLTVTATLVCFFLGAIIRRIYVINFSVDAIVGVVAAVIAFQNCRVKYRLLRLYTKSRDFYILDGAALLLSVLMKFVLPANVDVSLFIFMMAYFSEKRKFDKILDNIRSSEAKQA